MKDIRVIFVCTAIIIICGFAFFTSNGFKNNNKKSGIIKEDITQFEITHAPANTNKYSMKTIQPEEMARLYYNDYKNLIVNYPDEAFELIINDDISKEDFLEYRSKLINNYYDYSFKRYSYYENQTENGYVYRVTNSKDEVFSFKISAVMKYEVTITL